MTPPAGTLSPAQLAGMFLGLTWMSWFPNARVHHASNIPQSHHNALVSDILDIPPSSPMLRCHTAQIAYHIASLGLKRAGNRPMLKSYIEFLPFVSNVLNGLQTPTAVIVTCLVYLSRSEEAIVIPDREFAFEQVFMGALITAYHYTFEAAFKLRDFSVPTQMPVCLLKQFEIEWLQTIQYELRVTDEDILDHYHFLRSACIPRAHYLDYESRLIVTPQGNERDWAARIVQSISPTQYPLTNELLELGRDACRRYGSQSAKYSSPAPSSGSSGSSSSSPLYSPSSQHAFSFSPPSRSYHPVAHPSPEVIEILDTPSDQSSPQLQYPSPRPELYGFCPGSTFGMSRTPSSRGPETPENSNVESAQVPKVVTYIDLCDSPMPESRSSADVQLPDYMVSPRTLTSICRKGKSKSKASSTAPASAAALAESSPSHLSQRRTRGGRRKDGTSVSPQSVGSASSRRSVRGVGRDAACSESPYGRSKKSQNPNRQARASPYASFTKELRDQLRKAFQENRHR